MLSLAGLYSPTEGAAGQEGERGNVCSWPLCDDGPRQERIGLFPTDGLSQTLGDQGSSHHTVPAMPEVDTRFSSGLCWWRPSGYMPALHQVRELSLWAEPLFCRENWCCSLPTCAGSCCQHMA